MKHDLRFEFLADMTTQTLTVRREFAAKRPLVWDCHTKSELLDRWFAPKPLTTKTKHMDFRAGGHWHYVMITPDGEHYWNRWDYQSITPIDGYVAFDGFCDEAGNVNPEMPRSKMDVTFADCGDKTLVTTVVQYASAEDLQKVIDMGMKEGLASTLERLDELLEILV